MIKVNFKEDGKINVSVNDNDSVKVHYTDIVKGDKGEKGDKGDPGRDGTNGKDGINGRDGRDGIDGVNGKDGKDGEDGKAFTYDMFTAAQLEALKGPKGEQGERGLQGEKGENGDAGERGLQGVQGLKGDKGDKGDRGEQGLQGIQGIQGPKGDKGDKGDKGEPGTISDQTQAQIVSDVLAEVPSWAKASTKPSYTASEVGALPDTTVIPEAYDDSALAGRIAAIEGKEATWNAKSNFSGSYNDLTNKPTIPAAVTDAHINDLIDAKLGGIENGTY